MLCENSQVEVIGEVSEAEMANTTSVCWRDAAKRDFNVLGKFHPGCNNPIQQYGLWDWLNGKLLWREECECPARQQDSAVCSCSESIGFKNKAVASSYMYFPLLGTVRKYQKYLTVSGLCLALGSPLQEGYWHTGVSPTEGHQNGQGMEYTAYRGRLTEMCLLIQPGEEKTWGNFTVANIYLMGEYIGDKDKLFSEVCSKGMRASVLKLECKSFWLDIRKIFSL